MMLKRIVPFVVLFLFFNSTLADELKKAARHSSNGAVLQSKRIRAASENLANSTIPATNKKKLYVRKVVVAKNTYSKKRKMNMLTARYTLDKKRSKYRYVYDPEHVSANSDGYVVLPNIDSNIEKADISEAQIYYNANLKVMKISYDMLNNITGILK
ncbi:flagellar basal body rod protein FlgC [Candidatus Sneabacter namystus]|uniref:Flagellar basal-body rod protein FlgC n=1 Tax=Candidatus Sneabacter namystus TaxID=2601646 RepID=A0A5C0UID6_9RICK|nr:hypothetical protein [Candidatus Sneabacter namystus]QEK39549.1 hypothetical protein FZC37_01175 [Candidatus Sneabacter namystus]